MDDLVALLHGDPPDGFAVVSFRPNVWFDAPVALLDELYVRPDLRGRRIGHALIEAVEALAAERGGRIVEVNVDGEDTDARRFYAAHGYTYIEPGATRAELLLRQGVVRDPEVDRGPTPRARRRAGATVRSMGLSSRQTGGLTRVFVLAEQEAARNGDTRLGTAHLLLALARDERDHGGGLLDGLDLDRARAWLAATGVGYRDPGHRPWRPGAVFALATALRLADEAAEPTVGVRHLLLGVLADDGRGRRRGSCARSGLDVGPLVAGARSDLGQPGTAAIAARTWAASR